MKAAEREISRLMRAQLSVVTLDQARAAGLSTRQVQRRVANGEWLRLHAGVFTSAHSPATPARALMAACLAGGPVAAASHRSAAWLLKLVPHPPERPEITIPYGRAGALAGVTVHRSRDLDQSRVLERRGIRYTDPLRVLTDLADEMDGDELAIVTDRALYRGLVTCEGLEAEIARRRKRGRKGPPRLLDLLERRGMIGGPTPSVLEAQALRLFRTWGIPVLSREVHVGGDGRFRIDFLIAPGLSVEVDGYVYHWSPEAKAYDDGRRNRLRAAGVTVLVYDWRVIRREPGRVAREIRQALAGLGAGRRLAT